VKCDAENHGYWKVHSENHGYLKLHSKTKKDVKAVSFFFSNLYNRAIGKLKYKASCLGDSE
jgi:hypothetical protein